VNLQRKLTLSLAVGLLAPLTVVQTIQFLHIRSELNSVAKNNQAILEDMATRNIENIEKASTGFIKRGEMEDLDKQIVQITEIPGLIEYSLTDAKGVIRYSSVASRKRQSLPAEIKDSLLLTGKPIIRRHDNALQVYRPLISSADCAACHQKWKEGQVGGVQFFAFSDTDLVVAQSQAANSFHSIENSSVLWFVATGAVVAILIVVLTAWLLRRNIGSTVNSALIKLADGATRTADAAAQFACTSQDLADGSSGQAASLEETSSSLEEIASMAKHNAESAGDAKTISHQTLELAESGSASVTDMRTAMDGIIQAARNIAAVVKDIDEISFQTNLLALNAAVEAARAGAAGTGFAVVADEVRNLAQRAAKAAKKTEAMIDDSVQRSQRGAEITEQVAESFGKIVSNAKKVDALVAQISEASKEQGQGIGQLNVAVASMDKVTQNNASTAEQSAEAARTLDQQAKMLQGVVVQLNLLFRDQRAEGGEAMPIRSSSKAIEKAMTRPRRRPAQDTRAVHQI